MDKLRINLLYLIVESIIIYDKVRLGIELKKGEFEDINIYIGSPINEDTSGELPVFKSILVDKKIVAVRYY